MENNTDLANLLKSIDAKLSEIIQLLKQGETQRFESDKKPTRYGSHRINPLARVMNIIGGSWAKLGTQERHEWDVYACKYMPQRSADKEPVVFKGTLIGDRRKPTRDGYHAFCRLNAIAFTHGLNIPRLKPPSFGLTPPPPPTIESVTSKDDSITIKWKDPLIPGNIPKGSTIIVSLYVSVFGSCDSTIVANLRFPTSEEFVISALKISPSRMKGVKKTLNEDIVLTPDGKVPVKYLRGKLFYAQMETLIAEDDERAPVVSAGSNVMKIVI